MTLTLRQVVFQLVKRLLQLGSCFIIAIAVNKHFCASFHDISHIFVGKNPFFFQRIEQSVKRVPSKGSLRQTFLCVDLIVHSAAYRLTYASAFKKYQCSSAKGCCEVCLENEADVVRGVA